MDHAVGRYMLAHGHTPGPTHRPRTAGALSGAAAAGVSAPVLWYMGSVASAAANLGMARWSVVLLFVLSMALLGACYGVLFGRGANDRRGGWLLGVSYGFLLWLIGPVAALEWVVRRPVAVGTAAMGVAAAQVLYGLALGLVYPYVHDAIQAEFDQ